MPATLDLDGTDYFFAPYGQFSGQFQVSGTLQKQVGGTPQLTSGYVELLTHSHVQKILKEIYLVTTDGVYEFNNLAEGDYVVIGHLNDDSEQPRSYRVTATPMGI